MRLMKYVGKRGGIYRVRIVIPDAVRHAFPDLPKSGDYARSLNTSDETEAFEKAPPIIADIKRRIAEAKRAIAAGGSKAPVPAQPQPQPQPVTFRPAEIMAAIERWRFTSIREAEAAHFSGAAREVPFLGDEAHALSQLRYCLQDEERFGQIADFDDRLRAALLTQGLDVPVDHPVLTRPLVRAAFGEAWGSVENWTDEFRQDVFRWDEEASPEPSGPPTQPVSAPASPGAAPKASVTLSALLDRFIAAKQPKSEDDLRYHWRRLMERLGDVPVQTVSSEALEGFLIDLRRFPKTRRPEVAKLTFDEILRDHPTVGPPLAAPTVWKHFASYKLVFEYAHNMRLITFNPVKAVMPRKPKPTSEKRAYTPEEIEGIFSRPMFTGCAKTHNSNGELWGYRDEPGAILLKDGRYWMPILNLFHGNRMEEWGGAKLDDIKRDGDIDYLDLMQRTLKNDTAKRLLPIHPKVVELGFLDYVAERRAAGDEYLFPEFPHDTSESEDPEASTRQFTKWWGLWSDANGFPDPSVNFHSFRHTFKRACRGKISEELHDLITGHKGGGGAGRGYGRGADLQTLADAIKLVEIPTFPLPRGSGM